MTARTTVSVSPPRETKANEVRAAGEKATPFPAGGPHAVEEKTTVLEPKVYELTLPTTASAFSKKKSGASCNDSTSRPYQAILRVSNVGARILDLLVEDRNGDLVDVAVGHEDFLEKAKNHFRRTQNPRTTRTAEGATAGGASSGSSTTSTSNFDLHSDYFGATCGRVANRIFEGKYLDDSMDCHRPEVVELTKNEERVDERATGNDERMKNRPHYYFGHLHGGKRGFHAVVWEEVVDDHDSPETQEQNGPSSCRTKITFKRLSEDGEEGYPGAVLCFVTYELAAVTHGKADAEACLSEIEKDKKSQQEEETTSSVVSVSISYHAELVNDGRRVSTSAGSVNYKRRKNNKEINLKTPINLTNHIFFNLSKSHDESVLGHELQLSADTYLPVNPVSLVPTGERKPVAGTDFDFRKLRKIEKPGLYDHCFCLNMRNVAAVAGSTLAHADGQAPVPLSGPVAATTSRISVTPKIDTHTAQDEQAPRGAADPPPSAVLKNGKSGIELQVFTDQEGLQVYTGNFLQDFRGKKNQISQPGCAVCLECQRFPNSVNLFRENFECEDPFLKVGEKYEKRIEFRFSTF
ncbi:unnamed protein product [Amoebophrya sp. A120]|nr:unnamed protein product [Amoebophrya sp. A120]|eukprot:GSA120T00014425001.1